jgi:hypothetical protein
LSTHNGVCREALFELVIGPDLNTPLLI